MPNERLENYEVKCLVESAPQNAYMLVQQVGYSLKLINLIFGMFELDQILFYNPL